MNKFGILRRINKELKYVPIEEYVGTEIPIDISLNGTEIGNEIIELVEEWLKLKVKSIRFNNIEGTIAKYGMIDISLEIEDSRLTDDSKGIQILKENGWLYEENDAESKEDGLGFLEDMLSEIEEGKSYLKIHASSIVQKEKWSIWKSYLLKQILKGKKPKPRPGDKNRIFKIDDMCFTNYSGIWLWKHFYL